MAENNEAKPTKVKRKRKIAPPDSKTPPAKKRPRKETSTKAPIQWTHSGLKYIQHVTGHPLRDAFDRYVHSSLLQLPLQPGVVKSDTLHRHFEPAPFVGTTYPVPLITQRSSGGGAPESRRDQLEPMLRLVKAKRSYALTLSSMRVVYRRRKERAKKAAKGLRESQLYPSVVMKVADQLERDPDRWFSDAIGYDYYFSGGSLVVVDGERFRWIVGTVGERMDAVEIVPFDMIGGKVEVDTARKERYDLKKEEGAVFEICWREVEGGDFEDGEDEELDFSRTSGVMIALRKKNQIDVMWSKEDHDAMKIKCISTEVPFISCCFLQGTDGWLFCTSDLEKNVKVWNCHKLQMLEEFQLPKIGQTDDCWSCVRAIKKNHLIVLDRSSIRLVKVNTKGTVIREAELSSWLWICEKASILEVYPEESLLFVGTTHKLLILRLVNSRDDEPPDFHQIITFTHNLKHYPTMISHGIDSGQNYQVWISSQHPGDSKLCHFAKVPPKRFATNRLPRKPLTIQQSNHLARTKGKCLTQTSALKQRLQLFHSGLAIIVDSDHFHLLLQNSFGDIFYQQISNESNASEIPSRIHSWMTELNSSKPTTPLVTNFKSMRGFKRIFTCAKLSSSDPDPNPLENPFRTRRRWRQSVENLHQYKDLLAADMLSVWGFRPDVSQPAAAAATTTPGQDRRHHRERRLSTDVPMNVTDRISHWLEDTIVSPAAATDATTTEPIAVPSDNEEEAAGGTPREVQFVDEVRPTDESQLAAALVDVTIVTSSGGGMATRSAMAGVMTPKSAAKPARRKYIQGF